jgi:hypothetical protein
MFYEWAALRLLFAGSYSYSAGKVLEGSRRIQGLSDGLTQGRQVSFLCVGRCVYIQGSVPLSIYEML